MGWTANISTDLRAGGLNDITMDDMEFGWVGSFATLGAMLMCFPIGYICDLLGRKLAMLLLVIPFTIGYLCIIFANGIIMVYVGRFLIGKYLTDAMIC